MTPDARPIAEATVRFLTDAYAERERLAPLCKVLGRAIVKREIAPLREIPFHARTQVRSLPGFILARAQR